MVLPNLGSLAMWSPPLDYYGNSVRGVGFTRNLLSRFGNGDKRQSVFHPFSSKRATLTKRHTLTTVGTGSPHRALHTEPHRRELHTTARIALGSRNLIRSAARLIR